MTERDKTLAGELYAERDKALAGELYDIVEEMLRIASYATDTAARQANRKRFIDFCEKSEGADE